MNLPTYITGTTQALAYRLLREQVYEVLGRYDLTPTYWSMLGVIIEARDGVRLADIARTLHVKAPLVTNMARTLESRELVKSVPNQFDARAKLLAVTPAGKKFSRDVEQDLRETLKVLLSGLTESELAAYHKVLTTIITNAQALAEKK